VIQIPTIRATYTPSNNGTVRLGLTPSTDGDYVIELLIRRSGLVRHSREVRTAAATFVKVGTYRGKAHKNVRLTVTLKLTGRAAKILKTKGRLAVTVRTTLKPKGGGKPAVQSRSVTFKLKPRPKR
jgi:hypothetical protein